MRRRVEKRRRMLRRETIRTRSTTVFVGKANFLEATSFGAA